MGPCMPELIIVCHLYRSGTGVFPSLDTCRVNIYTKTGMVAGKANLLPHLLLFFDLHLYSDQPAVPEHIVLVFAFVLTFPFCLE